MFIIAIQFFLPLTAETESMPTGDDGHEHDNISPEEEAELLASDNEDMDVEPRDDDR